jgi:hypothetical protein
MDMSWLRSSETIAFMQTLATGEMKEIMPSMQEDHVLPTCYPRLISTAKRMRFRPGSRRIAAAPSGGVSGDSAATVECRLEAATLRSEVLAPLDDGMAAR